ncbi:MAG: excinuclease ABC subunit UvrC [Holosporales bacterium]|jgi:excinuclease ABC subunit C|nr:excinuclease ABC subunit UvrC [Holosporales bacterium]
MYEQNNPIFIYSDSEIVEKNTAPLLTNLERGRDVIKNVVKNFPLLPGIYRMLDINGEVIYVGKAKNLQNRVLSYTNINELSYRIKRMVSNVYNVVFTVTTSESAAIFLEADLIRTLKPLYNVQLKESTLFVSICVSKNHDFPRVCRHRGSFCHEKEEYCGPFSSVKSVEKALVNIQKLFKLRNCSDPDFATRKRPCLQYDIRRCSAPCVGKISIEEYAEAVQHGKDFLAGKITYVRDCLKSEMQKASNEMAFEKAARCRDAIRHLERLPEIEKDSTGNLTNADVIVLLHKGKSNKKEDENEIEEILFPCVYTLIIRNNLYLGGDTFFLSNEANYVSPEECIEAFIQQLYFDRTPPRRILLNYLPQNAVLLEEALFTRHNVRVHIEYPKKGNGKKWLQTALENAIEQNRYELAKNTDFGENFKKITKIFVLSKVPQRVEIYDNSHTQGSYSYGCFVVATKEGFETKSYRRFSVSPRKEDSEHEIGGDDFAMMEEVIRRRFKESGREILPDLMLIDGGAGQIAAVIKVLKEYELEHIPVIGIAKGPDRNAGRERFFLAGWVPISLPENDPTLFFIQRLRDEAHRFAIGTHRSARSRNFTKSQLSEIPGVGAQRKKLLLKKFGSIQRIKKASLDELCNVEGISMSVARAILDFLK